jgi:glycosyltransferase involved in cell wall biosynthesis
MKIGIDLRALQTGHKYRGIGEVAKQTTNRIIHLIHTDPSQKNSLIFYEYEGDNPKELLDISPTLKYEVVCVGKKPDEKISSWSRVKQEFRAVYGNPIPDANKCDFFLQFDYAFGVPANTKTILIKYDLIPYIFWNQFFKSPMVMLKQKALLKALRIQFENRSYLRILRRSLKKAHTILAISENTKRDLTIHCNIKSTKIKVVPLGVAEKPSKTLEHATTVTLPNKPYLLFVGIGDTRRRIEDLVAAYNNLKAEGHDLQLVLAGEQFKAPELISNEILRNAVLSSSYSKDILTLGYIDDLTKQRLYRDAIAFVYPTKYEGFGLPILEAMIFGCPVITYKNSSTFEVGGEHAFYADDWMEIKNKVSFLLSLPPLEKEAGAHAAIRHAQEFTWDKTAQRVYHELVTTNAG